MIFSSSAFERISGWSRQINYFEYAIDMIQQQWSFVQVACYFELNDQGETASRKGLFGVFDANLKIKGSGQMFARKIKYKFSSLSKTTLRRSDTTIATPLGVYPHDTINTYTPYFSWPSSPKTSMYQFCRFISSIQFTENGGEWWAMAVFNGGNTLLAQRSFAIE